MFIRNLLIAGFVLASYEALPQALGTNAGSGGTGNAHFGDNAGTNATTDTRQNVAAGHDALHQNTGSYNTAAGSQAMTSNTTGNSNTAAGFKALQFNTTGSNNTALGSEALLASSTTVHNTAIGAGVLSNNISGSYNTGAGYFSMRNNVSGAYNTAGGYYTLSNNNDGSYNTAFGYQPLRNSASSDRNTVFGINSLFTSGETSLNTIISRNIPVGASSSTFEANVSIEGTMTSASANRNVTIGRSSSTAETYNVAIDGSVTSGIRNTVIGVMSVAGNNNTIISNSMSFTGNNTIILGSTSTTSIGGYRSWSDLSDARFKSDIKEDVPGLDFITALKPRSYDVDKNAVENFLSIPDSVATILRSMRSGPTRSIGFSAQDVEKLVNKKRYQFYGVKAPQNKKSHYRLEYASFVVPLVKAMQELADKIDDQRSVISEQQKELDLLSIDLAATESMVQRSPSPMSANSDESIILSPANKTLQLSIDASVQKAFVVIYDLEGKEVKKTEIRERGAVTTTLEDNALPAGMYLYALITDKKVGVMKTVLVTNQLITD